LTLASSAWYAARALAWSARGLANDFGDQVYPVGVEVA